MALIHVLDIFPSSHPDSLSTFLHSALCPGESDLYELHKMDPLSCGQEIFFPACSLKCHQKMIESLLQWVLEDDPFYIGSISPAFSNPSFFMFFRPRTINPTFTSNRVLHYPFWFSNTPFLYLCILSFKKKKPLSNIFLPFQIGFFYLTIYI